MAVIGHYWTVRGFLDRRRVSAEIAPAEPWSATVNDPDLGEDLDRLMALGVFGDDGPELLLGGAELAG